MCSHGARTPYRWYHKLRAVIATAYWDIIDKVKKGN
jgi:hypothetical protein